VWIPTLTIAQLACEVYMHSGDILDHFSDMPPVKPHWMHPGILPHANRRTSDRDCGCFCLHLGEPGSTLPLMAVV